VLAQTRLAAESERIADSGVKDLHVAHVTEEAFAFTGIAETA